MKIKGMADGKNREASLAEGWDGRGQAEERGSQEEQNVSQYKEFKSMLRAVTYH